MTDYWKAYKEIIEADKLEQTKRETYTAESYK
jgi:IS1 family transposase